MILTGWWTTEKELTEAQVAAVRPYLASEEARGNDAVTVMGIDFRWHSAVPEPPDSSLLAYLAKRLLLTDREAQPLLFLDRLNDLDVALWEYEQTHGRIQTDIPEVERYGSYGEQLAAMGGVIDPEIEKRIIEGSR